MPSTTARTGRSSRTARVSRVAAGSLVAVAAFALTACQGGSNADAASSPSSSSKEASAGHTSQQSGSGASTESTQSKESAEAGNAENVAKDTTAQSGSASRSASASGATCSSADLGMSVGRGDPGAGNIRYPLVFTNNGDTACTLKGFPGVSLMQKDGQTIGKPAVREGAQGGAVRLAPGAKAHAVLHTLNDGVSDKPCWKQPYLVKAYAPGSKDMSTAKPNGLRVCGDEFSVTALKAGAAG
ncbi:DUF4232 domain-containing protein [Streptomyces sp. ODS28]|uniref:DUF4232 domain-containing protein n=1 Tax=Streptomyces sp. ODS28 TaxID=3136688 RepID=UPI0031EB889A